MQNWPMGARLAFAAILAELFPNEVSSRLSAPSQAGRGNGVGMRVLPAAQPVQPGRERIAAVNTNVPTLSAGQRQGHCYLCHANCAGLCLDKFVELVGIYKERNAAGFCLVDEPVHTARLCLAAFNGSRGQEADGIPFRMDFSFG
jgi:hypothetical protein